MLGLELLGSIECVVDEGKASALKIHAVSTCLKEQPSKHLATTEGVAHAKDKDAVIASLVHLGELLADFLLGQVGEVGVDHIHDLKSGERNMGKSLEDGSSAPFACVRAACW